MDRPFGMFPAHKPGELRLTICKIHSLRFAPIENSQAQSGADLPVVQTTKFELFIELKAARANEVMD